MAETKPFSGTPKEHLRALRLLCGSLVAGASLFAVICIVLNQMEDSYDSRMKELEIIFLAISAGVAISCFVAATMIYKKRLATAKGSLISLNEKLNLYRAALVMYLALCEGAALLAIIFFFLTGYYYLLIVAAIMIIAMLSKMPSKSKVITDLELDWQQQQELE